MIYDGFKLPLPANPHLFPKSNELPQMRRSIDGHGADNHKTMRLSPQCQRRTTPALSRGPIAIRAPRNSAAHNATPVARSTPVDSPQHMLLRNYIRSAIGLPRRQRNILIAGIGGFTIYGILIGLKHFHFYGSRYIAGDIFEYLVVVAVMLWTVPRYNQSVHGMLAAIVHEAMVSHARERGEPVQPRLLVSELEFRQVIKHNRTFRKFCLQLERAYKASAIFPHPWGKPVAEAEEYVGNELFVRSGKFLNWITDPAVQTRLAQLTQELKA